MLKMKLNTGHVFIKLYNRNWLKSMVLLVVLAGLFGLPSTGLAQEVSINPTGAKPDPSAMLDVSSTNKGFLPPRLTNAQMGAVSSPAAGLLIYNTDQNRHFFYNGSSWVELKNSQADSASVPVGTILPFGADSSKIPSGYLHCAGQSLSTTTYSDLFAIIGYSWGGSGSSFNLPDLRGRFLRGVDYGAGNDPDRASRVAINTGSNTGDEVGSLQGDAIRNITGSVTTRTDDHAHNVSSSGAFTLSNAGTLGNLGSGTGTAYKRFDFNASNQVPTASQNRPVNASVNYIICYSSTIAASSGSGTFQGTVPASSLPSSVVDSSKITDGDSDTYISTVNGSGGDNDNLRFITGGTERMRVKADGTVGIGTNNPTALLQVTGTPPADANSAQIRLEEGTAANSMNLGRAEDYGFIQTQNAEPLALNPLGNRVGIGITDPTSLLTVAGANPAALTLKNTSNTQNHGLAFQNSGSGYTWALHREQTVADSADFVIRGGNVDNDIANLTERLRIAEDGKVSLSGASQISNLNVSNTLTIEGNTHFTITNTTQTNRNFTTIFSDTSGIVGGAAISMFGKDDQFHARELRFYTTGTKSGSSLIPDVSIDSLGKVGIGYGNTDLDSLLSVDGGVLAKTLTLTNGAGNNKVLTSNANGLASWAEPATATSIADADNDTKIQVEESADEDVIRFDIGGTEYYRMNTGRIEVVNTGNHIFIGQSAGESHNLATATNGNIGIGLSALSDITSSTGNNLTAVGSYALRFLTNGHSNTAIGANALSNITSGTGNTSIGANSLQYATSGSGNIAFGYGALRNKTGGSNNIAIGTGTLGNNITGADNVAVGDYAGSTNTGTGNVFIGNNAGQNASSESNKLFIENSNSASPLIWGDFSADSISIHGSITSTSGMRITGGKMAIGGTETQGLFTLYGDSSNLITLKSTDNTLNSGIAFQNSGNAYSWVMRRVNSATANNPDLVFVGGNANADITTLNERMRITHDGKVGVGVSAPENGILHLNQNSTIGSINVADKTKAVFHITDSGGDGYFDANSWYVESNSMSIGTLGAFGLSLGTNGTQRLLIESGGDVGVGTTNALAGLHVSGSEVLVDNTYGFSYRNAANSSNYNLIKSTSSNEVIIAGTNTQKIDLKVAGANPALTIANGGNVGIGVTPNSIDELLVSGVVASNSALSVFGSGLDGVSLQRLTLAANTTNKNYLDLAKDGSNTRMPFYIKWRGEATSASALYIDASSNIGIGTDSPTEQLTIGGPNDKAEIFMTTGDDLEIRTDQQDNGLIITDGTGGVQLNYASTEKMRVDNDVTIKTELHSNNTGNFNLMPLAMAIVDETGAIINSTGNVSVTRVNQGDYTVTVSGHTASLSNDVVVATIIGTNKSHISVRDSGTGFGVQIRAASGIGDVDSDFSIIIYSK